jgi:multimeric flavodoxin WrbA
MKIIGICGSPRKGNTETLLKEALNKVEEMGLDTELILLRNKKIEFCDGCLICNTTGQCHIDDGMQKIYEDMTRSDAIIFGSPTYYNNVTGLFKNFIDRTNVFYPNKNLKNKIAAIICVGEMKLNEGSIENATEQISIFCRIHKMKLVGRLLASVAKKNEISQNQKILKKARDLGLKVAKIIVSK